jgi:CutA1 divalent ion tolerance protein
LIAAALKAAGRASDPGVQIPPAPQRACRKIYERTEGRASLHTSNSRVREIVDRAKKDHPYEVPGVSTRPITSGNPDYLAWIKQETTP